MSERINHSLIKVAVLLATYNGSDYIRSQINTILGQEGVSIDLYIRDDGSFDSTCEEINCYMYDERVHILCDNVKTGSAAGNFFRLLDNIKNFNYSYVAFADQDDVWFPEKIINAIRLIEHTNADAYSSNLISFDNGLQESYFINKYSRWAKFDYLFQGASAGCTYVLSSKATVLLVNVLNNFLTSFPVGYSHDWLIYAICRSHNLKWIHDNRAYIAYRQHGRNAFGAMPGFQGVLMRFKLARSGWYREQIQWNRQFLLQTRDELRVLNAVKNFKLIDRLYLIINVLKFRRSKKDCFLIAMLFLLGLI